MLPIDFDTIWDSKAQGWAKCGKLDKICRYHMNMIIKVLNIHYESAKTGIESIGTFYDSVACKYYLLGSLLAN